MTRRVRYLADVNISPATVAAVRSAGFDIHRVDDNLPPTAPDSDIIALAIRHNRTVITQDLDFSALVALSGKLAPSILTLRLNAPSPAETTAVLRRVLPAVEPHLVRGALASTDGASVRVRALPVTAEGHSR